MSKLLNKDETLKSLQDGELIIIDFFAKWCGPCQMLLPIYTEVANKQDSINMSSIDIDENPDIAADNGVMGVPTIVAFRNGKEISRITGFQTKEALVKFINSVK